MKVIYPIPSDLNSASGHTQHVLGICRNAAKFGVDIELYCIKSNNNSVINEFKVKQFDIDESNSVKKIFLFCNEIKAEIIKNPKPDLIYFRPFPLDYFLLTKFLLKQNIPYAYELNTLWADELKSHGKEIKALIYPWFEAKTIQNANALLPITNEIAEYAHSVGGKSIPTLVTDNGITIPSTVDLNREQVRLKWSLPINKKLIVMAGFTRPWHGYDKLIRALTLTDTDLHVVLIGSEDESIKRTVREFSKAQKVSERVHILPWLRHEDVNEIIFCSDVGVSPLALEKKNMKEARSLKVRHYLALGLPVLLAGDDSKEIMNSSFVHRLIDTNESQIAEGLIRLTEADFPREEIISFAKLHLSWEATAFRTFNFLKQLIS